ncbi:unnamed protein product, partial [Prorocentrum cordatum]
GLRGLPAHRLAHGGPGPPPLGGGRAGRASLAAGRCGGSVAERDVRRRLPVAAQERGVGGLRGRGAARPIAGVEERQERVQICCPRPPVRGGLPVDAADQPVHEAREVDPRPDPRGPLRRHRRHAGGRASEGGARVGHLLAHRRRAPAARR